MSEYKSRPSNVYYHEVKIDLEKALPAWNLRNECRDIQKMWPIKTTKMLINLSNVGVVKNNGFVVCRGIKTESFNAKNDSDEALITTLNDLYSKDSNFHTDMCHVSHNTEKLKVASIGIAYKSRKGCRDLLLDSKETQDAVLNSNSDLRALFSGSDIKRAIAKFDKDGNKNEGDDDTLIPRGKDINLINSDLENIWKNLGPIFEGIDTQRRILTSSICNRHAGA